MRHVYIHVPFCSRRCSYCDFAIAVRTRVPEDAFVRAIDREVTLRGDLEDWSDSVDTLYLGGGTPSKLSAQAIGRLVGAFRLDPRAEVTLEANPEDVTQAAAQAWRAVGVTRVSVGVQTFDDTVLAWMHRTHDARTAREAAGALRAAGFESISLDLIFGVPEALGHDPRRDLDEAIALDPDHVSVYGLTVEPRTPVARWIERGTATPAPDERFAAAFLAAHQFLVDAGFDHYELSNYARRVAGTSHRSRHNGAYWSGAPYAGLGPSAHGFTGLERRWNVREWAAYERAIGSGADPVAGTERLGDPQRHLERIYLGLRTAEGIEPDLLDEGASERIRAATDAGWLERTAGRLRATPAGWLMLDELIPTLTTWPEGG